MGDREIVSHCLKEVNSVPQIWETKGRRRLYKIQSELPLVTLCLPSLPCFIPPEHSSVVSRCRKQTILRCCAALPGSSMFIYSCPVIFLDCRNTALLVYCLLIRNFPSCNVQDWLPSSSSFCNQGWVWLLQLTPWIINKWSCNIFNVTFCVEPS